MKLPDNAIERFGSARFATQRELARAGLFRQQPNSLFVGFFKGKPLWYSGAGGVCLVAGARGGKLRDILAYNICSGVCLHTMFILDMKGELAAISQDQTPDRKHCLYWNPHGLHGLPQHRINPFDYITRNSPSLVSDIKQLCQNLIPKSGSANGGFFESRAQEVLEALMLTIVDLRGVLTPPDLYYVVNLIPGDGDNWHNFAYAMSQSRHEIAVRIEEEISASRSDSSSGGFQGILGEVFKSVACLSDPVLMDSVSPPYDFSLGDPCRSEHAYQVYFMPPAEFVESWSPILKSMFVAGMIYKSRAPQAMQQTFILDECAQLAGGPGSGFPLITKLYTYGAGIGLRPVTIWQSANQMRAVSPDAETIIPSSAACQISFAIRDIGTANMLSQALGAQTLEYDDLAQQAQANHAKREAMHSILNGNDPLSAGLNYRHQKQQSIRKTKQQRQLRTADEILHTPEDKAYIFVDGLGKPIFAPRKPYWTQRFMAGRYFPNPYHPPLDSVRVMTRWGSRTRQVIHEPVPDRFSDYPQYADGTWSRIKH